VSKRWGFGLAAVYVLVVLSPWLGSFQAPLAAPPAEAAGISTHFQGGHWAFINRMEIGYYDSTNALIYIAGDNQLDGNFTYNDFALGKQEDNQGDICNLSVEPQHHTVTTDSGSNPLGISRLGDSVPADKLSQLNPLTVTYHIWNAPSLTQSQGQCDSSSQSFTVSAQDLSNFNISFSWLNPNTIESVFPNGSSSNEIFTAPTTGSYEGQKESITGQSGQYPNISGTYNVWLDGQPGTHCVDYLLVPVNPNANSVIYWENDDTKGGDQAYFDHSCQISEDGNTNLDEAGTSVASNYTAAQKQLATPAPTNNVSNACQITGGFGWILCPLIDMANKIYIGDTTDPTNPGGLEGQVTNILKVSPLDNTTYAGAFAVWGAFRNLSNLLFILIFLVIIFSNTLSIGMSNYDIKKVLPKLVIAVVFVQFSWVLMQLAVDISNILGAGIGSLIHTALASAHVPIATTPPAVINAVGGVLFGLAGAAVGIAFALPLLFALFGLILGVIAIFLTLEFRQLLLLILVVLSPIAFIAWVLPNTENIFKTWLKTLTRLLLMYPLIVLIFAMAGIAQAITHGTAVGAWPQILTSLLPIAAFYAVPWTFKWAGGAMNAAGGFFVGRAAGINRNFQTSQFAKDKLQQRREKGALNAHDENKSAPRRYLGKIQAGAGMPGAGSNRRLSAAYATAMKARGQDYESDFQNRKLDKSQLRQIAMGKNGARINGVKVDDAARAKAIELLGRKGEYKILRRVQESMSDAQGNMTPGQSRVWQNGSSSNIGDLLAKAPDLVSGAGAFHNVTADKMAGFHSSTFEAMTQHLATPGGAQDMKGILRALEGIAASPALRGKVDSLGLGKVIEERHIFSGETTASGEHGDAWLNPARTNAAGQPDPAVRTSTVNLAGPGEPPENATSATFLS